MEPTKLDFKNKLIFLLKDTFFFGGVKGISMLFPFFTIPILTTNLTLEEYGLYENFLILIGLLTLFLVFAQDSAVARWYYNVDSAANKKQVITESLLFQIALIVFIIPLLFFFSKEISILYFKNLKLEIYVKLIILISVPKVFINFSTNILKWTYNRKKYLIVTIIQPLLIFISALLLIFSNLKFLHFFYLIFISSSFSAFLGLFFCKQFILIKGLKFKYLKKLLSYSLPFAFISILEALIPAIDRAQIIDNLTLNDLGVYNFIFKVASIFLIFQGIIDMAWGPFSLSIYKEKDAERVFNTIFILYILITVLFIIFLIESKFFLLKFLGNSSYTIDLNLFYILLLTFFLNGAISFTSLGISISLKTYLNIIPFFVTIISLLFFLNQFTVKYGILGVGISLLLSTSLKFLSISIISNRVFKTIQLKWIKPTIIVTVFFVCYFFVKTKIEVIFVKTIIVVILYMFIFLVLMSKSHLVYIKDLLIEKIKF